MLTNLIVWCIFGLIAGALARLFIPGRDPLGCFMTILLGVGGSVVGGLLGWLLQGSPAGGFRPAHLIGSVIGAMILLLIYRKMGPPRF